MRDENLLDVRAPGVPPAGHRQRSRGAARLLPGRESDGRLRHGHQGWADDHSGQPEVSLPRRTAPGQRRAGCRLPHHRSRSRVPPGVLPLGPAAGRRAARCRREGQAARRQGARGAGPAAAGRSQVQVAGHQLRLSVAASVRAIDNIDPDAVVFPSFDDGLREAFRQRDRAVRGQHPARGPQRARPADRGPYLRQRAAGAPLRDSERARRAVPPRDARRCQPLGAARERQRAAGHVVPQSHRARAARRLDPGEHPRHAAGGAAARRRGVQGKQGRREGPLGARDHGAAPRKPSCNACHGVMDPLGFALENFDAIGEWRSKDRVRGHRHRCVRQARRRHAR